MKNDPLVSVLMSVYKESVDVVSKSIDSIREQTYTNLELVILLDAPENCELKGFLKEVCTRDPRMKLHVNPENLGLVDSLNRGMLLCNGSLICRMDADDIAGADRIEKQVNYMNEKQLDLTGCYMSLIDMGGKTRNVIRKYPTKDLYIKRYLKYSTPVPHPTWLVKRVVYEQLSGYRHISYAEDYDFLIRAKILGYKMGVLPIPLLYYRINTEGITQKNIASQKVVSVILAKQLKKNTIFSEKEIAEYRKRKESRERKLKQYYLSGKQWKNGEKIGMKQMITLIFNTQNFIELQHRIACQFILREDKADDNY